MPRITSKVNPGSETFQAQRADMLARLGELRGVEAKVRATEEKAREKFHKRGQMLPRERLMMLLDRGSPFLELSTLCGYGYHDDSDGSLAGGNSIAGIGYVSGVRCFVFVNNSAIKGGTASPWGVQKALRGQAIALQNKLPMVSLVESGGANLMYQQEIFIPGGETFYNQARMSAAGIPQVTVVHGSSTAGGAYLPGLSDYVVMVKKKAKVFLAGPPLLKAATGEVATDEDLGGAEMHATVAGTADYLAEDDADAIRMAREIVSKLGWNERLAAQAKAPYAEPLYPPDELAGAIPADYRKPYDCREIIARIVDGSEFTGFKDAYDAHTVCGWASLFGGPIGIIGNNGPISPKGATKAAQFIQLCCQSNTPIVYLQNTTGYLVGTQPEQGGIVKHGSKMIQAVANATVPQVTLLVGGSFGAGNYGMCGRPFHPRFIFAWPNARTAVMGGEQAAKVMSIVFGEKLARGGEVVDEEAIRAFTQPIVDQFDKESHPFNASARLFDDGIIDPRDTRRVLGFVLSICREAEARPVNPNSFGVARL
ncbi:geranyl-CoA carboxylase beta subunit [Myxococcus fulvus]|uniref:Acetyl-CoA carboxylase carboxyltransferase subunit n=1 Tax=Myxococcus fulvus TaxID=33 RepID=A0A511TJG2_MYXFU|nr:carboxyl transferase domain-containing protein [Myxococcus fulvus]AKF79031.1 methylcrotonoyl-CoA carboxylase [Myxococcus fulvus 124B02]GEN13358.1 acetyl-CoA carboxylase carboxyltransferase subunit [Myxococcus fulvus]SEU41789.1 geranyl-CoA carboxylase beta subunit [Myxococcus fulvus]